MFAGLVVMVAALDAGAGPEIVTWPMLLAGLGIGALASQLGSVTVSSVPDEQSGEVGGLQNTITNLGISIGTALTGAIVDRRPQLVLPHRRRGKPGRARAGQGAGPRPSCPAASPSSPTTNWKPRSTKRGCRRRATDAIVEENEDARLDGLRTRALGPRPARPGRPLLHRPDPDPAAGRGGGAAGAGCRLTSAGDAGAGRAAAPPSGARFCPARPCAGAPTRA